MLLISIKPTIFIYKSILAVQSVRLSQSRSTRRSCMQTTLCLKKRAPNIMPHNSHKKSMSNMWHS